MNSHYQEVALTLDYSDMACDIYATTAMHSYLSPEDSPMPPLLTQHNLPALVPAMKSAFIFLSLRMLPLIAQMDINGTDTIDLTLKVNADTARRNLDILRHTLRNAIIAYTMYTCWLGIDNTLAQQYHGTALSAVTDLNRLGCMTPELRIKGHL